MRTLRLPWSKRAWTRRVEIEGVESTREKTYLVMPPNPKVSTRRETWIV